MARGASGERFRVWRTRFGDGVMWEKLRWRRCEMARGSESGFLRSSEERDRAIGSGSSGRVWGGAEGSEVEKCLAVKSESGVKRSGGGERLEERRCGRRGGRG